MKNLFILLIRIFCCVTSSPARAPAHHIRHSAHNSHRNATAAVDGEGAASLIRFKRKAERIPAAPTLPCFSHVMSFHVENGLSQLGSSSHPLSDLNELFGITSPPTYGNYDFYCDDEAPKRCSECMDSLGEQKKCSGELTSTCTVYPRRDVKANRQTERRRECYARTLSKAMGRDNFSIGADIDEEPDDEAVCDCTEALLVDFELMDEIDVGRSYSTSWLLTDGSETAAAVMVDDCGGSTTNELSRALSGGTLGGVGSIDVLALRAPVM